MTTVWHRLSRNAATTIVATVVSLGVGFVLMPYVVRHLGPSAFGIWVLANSVVGYLGLLDVGLSPTLTKKSAELVGSGLPEDIDKLNRTVSTITVLYVGLGLILGAGIGLLALSADRLFNVSASELQTLRAVLWVVGLQTALGFPMSVWNALVCGLQDYHVLSAINITVNILRGILTVLILRSGGGLVDLVWMGFGLAAFAWMAGRWRVRRRIPALRIRAGSFDPAKARELGQFSGVMLIWSVAGYALHQADRVLIGLFRPVAAVTTYEVGGRLSNYSRSIMHSWLDTIFPTASALGAEGDRATLRVLYLRATKYLLASYAAVVVALMAFGRAFIDLWMGSGFAASYWVMALLLFGNLYQSQNVVAHVMLAGTNELRAFKRVMLAYPIVVVGLGIPMTIHGGLPGAAGSILCSILILETAFLRAILKNFETSLAQLLRTCHRPVAYAVGLSVLWAVLMSALLPRPSWAVLVLQVGSTVTVYTAAFWALGMSGEERSALVRRTKALVGLGGT